jgi:hypothetical protein
LELSKSTLEIEEVDGRGVRLFFAWMESRTAAPCAWEAGDKWVKAATHCCSLLPVLGMWGTGSRGSSAGTLASPASRRICKARLSAMRRVFSEIICACDCEEVEVEVDGTRKGLLLLEDAAADEVEELILYCNGRDRQNAGSVAERTQRGGKE